MEKRKVTLFVLGQRFTLITTDSEKYLDELVKRLESKVNELQRAFPFLSAEGYVTLAALDYCDEKQKLKIDYENIRAQIKDYLDESGRLRARSEELEEENNRLKKEIEALKRLNEKEGAQQRPQKAVLQRRKTITVNTEPEKDPYSYFK